MTLSQLNCLLCNRNIETYETYSLQGYSGSKDHYLLDVSDRIVEWVLGSYVRGSAVVPRHGEPFQDPTKKC